MLPDRQIGIYLTSTLMHKFHVKATIPANETTKHIAVAIRL